MFGLEMHQSYFFSPDTDSNIEHQSSALPPPPLPPPSIDTDQNQSAGQIGVLYFLFTVCIVHNFQDQFLLQLNIVEKNTMNSNDPRAGIIEMGCNVWKQISRIVLSTYYLRLTWVPVLVCWVYQRVYYSWPAWERSVQTRLQWTCIWRQRAASREENECYLLL